MHATIDEFVRQSGPLQNHVYRNMQRIFRDEIGPRLEQLEAENPALKAENETLKARVAELEAKKRTKGGAE